MRILVVTDVTVRGGVDRYVLDLARALREVGHEPVLVLEETTTSELCEATADVAPPCYAALYHGRHELVRLREAARAVLDGALPDGVHVVCGSPRSCLVLREEAGLRGLPVVVTEQQVPEDLALSSADVRRVRATYRSARQVVFVSAGNRDTMDRLVGLDGVATRVIPNGVEVARVGVRAAAVPRRTGAPGRVMTAARFAPEKGLDVLLRAVARLPRSTVDTVDLYGDGPERAALERLVAELDLDDRVGLHRWRDDIPEQMARHDLFVLPSTAEGMPYALLEAMAAGIPVIASDVPGNVEALAGGSAGTVVPRRDPAALAAAMAARLADPDGTARLARAAHRRARERYDLSGQMRRTVALWPPARTAPDNARAALPVWNK
jgi:glycosyltransferase involved in cell wall biosynthesis